jgi:hypothetical protein
MTFRDKIVKECIEIMGNENIKKELRVLLRPFLHIIFKSFSPYIELLLGFLVLNFVLIIFLIYYVVYKNKMKI